jgi:putative membrane protein
LRKPVDYIVIFIKGLSMGAADVIPGVSGGTVAFITGIYNELIHAIRAVDLEALRLLRAGQLRACWKKINGPFLFTLLLGILTSLLTLARLVYYLLHHHAILVWSFFFGLILISAPLVTREIKKWNAATLLAFIAGMVAAYLITVLTPAQSPENLPFIFLSGVLAICAMILPGISGAFILLLLGKYQYMVNALLQGNIPVLVVFALGCITGILAFSRLLTWILDHYHGFTVALLSGFMLGSLNKIWPWRHALEYRTTQTGERLPVYDVSIMPWDYLSLTGKDPQLIGALIMMALGVLLVYTIEKTASLLKPKT